MSSRGPSILKRALRWRRWARRSANNALLLARDGLGGGGGAPYQVVAETSSVLLRHYLDDATVGNEETSVADRSRPSGSTGPLLLIPPLMLTAEIYDVAPDLSAVRQLQEEGIDVWVADFGAPEQVEGGMQRTLSDHVKAVAWAIGEVAARTGQDVHIAGYSQGGMFAYQAAALRHSSRVASIITFGSPVDIHKSVPSLASDLAGRFLETIAPMVQAPLSKIEGLPGILTSSAFKALTPRKEVQQMVDTLAKLHDRSELERKASRRRFLGGEGFVSWPGPALRSFFDDVIVENRMLTGGFVIDGRAVSLSDLSCPILCFVGVRDDLARPAAVRAIAHAAPNASVFDVTVQAGHFGLVVGRKARAATWPLTAKWIRWQLEGGPTPAELVRTKAARSHEDEPDEAFEVGDLDLFGSELIAGLESGWRRTGELARSVGEAVDTLRYQVPRLWRLDSLEDGSVVGVARALSQQATRRPDATFFLWRGRALSFAQADRRVSDVARGLWSIGVRPGNRCALLMKSRPSLLVALTALNRIRAVAVVIDPEVADDAIAEVTRGCVAFVSDPEHASRGQHLAKTVHVLGGGTTRSVPPHAVDMEAIDVAEVAIAATDLETFDGGLGGDQAFELIRPAEHGTARRQRITNRRWALSALGSAASSTLRQTDTAYCALPVHHPTGLLVGVGAALAVGARLALAERFDATDFWSEARRYGATVAIYAGHLFRPLVQAAPTLDDRKHSLRLAMGSGMPLDLWRQMRPRFGIGVLEFYATTEDCLVLANAAGRKVGSVGRPLVGSVDLALVALPSDGTAVAEWAHVGVAGQLAIRTSVDDPRGSDLFGDGRHFSLRPELMKRDAQGDFWLTGRVGAIADEGELPLPLFAEAIAAISGACGHALCTQSPRSPRSVATVWVESQEPLPRTILNRLAATWEDGAIRRGPRPQRIERVSRLPLTTGYRISVRRLIAEDHTVRVLESVEFCLPSDRP